MLFLHVKISSFRAKARLVFHWRLYNKVAYHQIAISFPISCMRTKLSNSPVSNYKITAEYKH